MAREYLHSGGAWFGNDLGLKKLGRMVWQMVGRLEEGLRVVGKNLVVRRMVWQMGGKMASIVGRRPAGGLQNLDGLQIGLANVWQDGFHSWKKACRMATQLSKPKLPAEGSAQS